jgi:hypothetical protein
MVPGTRCCAGEGWPVKTRLIYRELGLQLRGQQPHQQLIDHGHVECIERPSASASGLHTLRSLYH